GVVPRELIALAGPGEAAALDAVGEREEHGDAAARRPAVLEEVRVAEEQLAPARVPAEAVEAQGRADLGGGPLRPLQLPDRDLAAPGRPGLGGDLETHGLALPT